jgi:hypothetical protein
MMSEYKHLVLTSGYVESSENTFLIFSKIDGSSFEPVKAGAELVEVIRRSCDKRRPWPSLGDDEFSASRLVYEAFWGTADSTGWTWDELNNSGWTYGSFPESSNDCFFVSEHAELWLFQCWEILNPDWREELKNKKSQDLRESALGKLTLAEKVALGLSD